MPSRDGTDHPLEPQSSDESFGNLVALALGQLAGGEADSVRASIESDPAIAREFDSIRAHLDLHAHVREIQPMPGGFERLRSRMDADSLDPATEATPAKTRGFLQRYWMSVAAAALMLIAVFVPRGVPSAGKPTNGTPPNRVASIAGSAVKDADGNWNSDGLCRIAYGDGVTVTMDVDTTVIPMQEQRLALQAGRIFVEVEPGRKGFTVVVGNGRIVTLGTSFLVEHGIDNDGEITGRVAVEHGRVAFRMNGAGSEIAAGSELRWTTRSLATQALATRALPAGARLRWYEIPSLSAKILNDRTVVVVIRNEMIDPIQLAPPTGGEPLFYATVGNHSYPHAPANFGRNVVLAPGTDFTFEMKLPQALEPGQSVIIHCPSLGLEAEAETGR